MHFTEGPLTKGFIGTFSTADRQPPNMASKDELHHSVIRINEKDARNVDPGVSEKEQGYDSVTSVFIFCVS